MSSKMTPEFMNEMASAIDNTVQDRLGEGVGFVLIAVSEADGGSTDFQYVSNITDEATLKELMTHVVTHNETQQ